MAGGRGIVSIYVRARGGAVGNRMPSPLVMRRAGGRSSCPYPDSRRIRNPNFVYWKEIIRALGLSLYVSDLTEIVHFARDGAAEFRKVVRRKYVRVRPADTVFVRIAFADDVSSRRVPCTCRSACSEISFGIKNDGVSKCQTAALFSILALSHLQQVNSYRAKS